MVFWIGLSIFDRQLFELACGAEFLRGAGGKLAGNSEAQGSLKTHQVAFRLRSRSAPRCIYGRRPHTVPYSSNATLTNWLRVRTPVFIKSCCNADFTEASEIFN